MGVEPFITGAAVSAVLAQRLARKLCPHCAEPYRPRATSWSPCTSPRAVEELEKGVFHRKRGCPRCGETGYRGRIGVFQLLEMTPSSSSSRPRRHRATSSRSRPGEGMRTMWEDGIGKVAAGITTGEELARVCST